MSRNNFATTYKHKVIVTEFTQIHLCTYNPLCRSLCPRKARKKTKIRVVNVKMTAHATTNTKSETEH